MTLIKRYEVTILESRVGFTKEVIILRGVIALILSGTLPGMILGVSLMLLIVIFLYLIFKGGKKN